MDFSRANKNKCDKCGMNSGNDCCKTKVTVVKLSDDQQISSTNIKVLSPFAAITRSYLDYKIAYPYLTSPTLTKVDSPPPRPGSFLCKLYSVFLI
ncbi:MAG: hypothetical protein ABIN25_09865 [Ginsengibacter sp.]